MAVQHNQTPLQRENKGQPMPLYELSSQFRNWRYSKEQLVKIRDELNLQAVQRVRDKIEEERAQHSASLAQQGAKDGENGSRMPTPPPASEIEYLTVADEQSLVTYYLTQVSSLCGAFKFPENVQATAMTYLKRFYLRNTCMDYHPKNVMLTCVFLATKTENFPVSIDSFASRVKTAPDDILSLEFLVSQSLMFEYKVHHAHLAASGLLLDMQTTGIAIEALETAYAAAKSFIRTSRLTDLELVYAPSQIALAAFRLSDHSAVDTWLGVKQSLKDGRAAGADTGVGTDEASSADQLAREQLVDALVDIGEAILDAKDNPVDKAKVTEVDKRLRWARNPEKDPKSALYKKRQAEEQAHREDKAKIKAASKPPNDDGSVFD